MNKLIGDESIELEYRRAESCTFEIDLTGCVTTFSPILIKSKLAKNIVKDIVNIDFELKKNKIL